ncbi:hypothetical protein ABGT15_12770 [Flavobacterium enshiense]|uniref:hypothetical protein n=1 Tax=Flavobacterium enshiense TaxID=1341165 RepID=UPI00345CB571
MEVQLKLALSQAIGEFNNHRSEIIDLAYQNGGQTAVKKIENEYDALRDAYFEILKRELDKNNHLYEELVNVANSETERLKASLKQLNNINDIIKLTTSVINMVGRVLIVLGL